MPTPVTLAALGSWDMRVCVLSLPDLSVVAEQTAAKEVIPRSMLLANCDGCCYLLCGMGDGALITHRIDPQTGMVVFGVSCASVTQSYNHTHTIVHIHTITLTQVNYQSVRVFPWAPNPSTSPSSLLLVHVTYSLPVTGPQCCTVTRESCCMQT